MSGKLRFGINGVTYDEYTLPYKNLVALIHSRKLIIEHGEKSFLLRTIREAQAALPILEAELAARHQDKAPRAPRNSRQTSLVDERPQTQIPRKKARELGMSRYFTGTPCKHGHLCERYTVSATCVECMRLANDQNKVKSNSALAEA